MCVREFVRLLSRFNINLNISFIYKDIFTKFAGNVYGYENLSVQNFSLILKNKIENFNYLNVAFISYTSLPCGTELNAISGGQRHPANVQEN